MSSVLRPLAVALCIALPACRAAAPTDRTPGPGEGQAPSALGGTTLARAFDCRDGPSFVLVPSVAGAADVELPDGVRRLARQPAGSGARYSDGTVVAWNKGREALLERDGRTYRCTENHARSIRADARVRGVDFRATGNEPGWVLELLRDRIVFLGAYGAERVTVPRPAARVDAASGETVYAAGTEGHRIRVQILTRECVDSMSGDRTEAAVAIEVDGRVYHGCGYGLP